MAILSEGKGVMMWLKSRGNNELFSGYLLKLFNDQTKISFYKISFTDCDRKKFQRFTTWYGFQNLSKLKPLVKIENKIVDVSDLQWYDQIKLDHVFNLI